jgi:hypothetical protein
MEEALHVVLFLELNVSLQLHAPVVLPQGKTWHTLCKSGTLLQARVAIHQNRISSSDNNYTGPQHIRVFQ